jgi:hypothetical protein
MHNYVVVQPRSGAGGDRGHNTVDNRGEVFVVPVAAIDRCRELEHHTHLFASLKILRDKNSHTSLGSCRSSRFLSGIRSLSKQIYLDDVT